jgi:hypothetical protein
MRTSRNRALATGTRRQRERQLEKPLDPTPSGGCYRCLEFIRTLLTHNAADISSQNGIGRVNIAQLLRDNGDPTARKNDQWTSL